MNILTVKDLSLQVSNERLLKSVSFGIKQGEIFALVGESGSGKSLTSLAIMRLLPEALKVTSGDILLNDSSLFSISEFQMQKLRGRKIAMIFQEPMTALNPVMTIGEQVAEVIRLHLDLSEQEIESKVIELFEEVGLKDAKARYTWYPHQLSGGQKQRIMISMALACEPELLIADEPTTALDVTIQAQVLALLKEIQEKRSLSILFITHDMGVVVQMADTVAVMRYGEVLEIAQKDDFFRNPRHTYSQSLLRDALPSKEFRQSNKRDATLLEIKDLKVYFPIKKGFFKRTVGHTKAVDGISLSIPKGQTLALVGESGSGKSTIGTSILQLIESTDGSIFFNGIDLTKLSQKAFLPYRRKVQIVFQDPYSALNPRMTVGEIIREGMVSLNVGLQDKNIQNMIIKDLLVDVGLAFEHFYRYPHEFSGGQRQRIGIARALAVEPELIICDEPTSALDVSVRSQVLKLLKKLQKERALSYLFITHDLSIISVIADEVAVMKEGKIVEQGLVEEVMENPQHRYTQKLLASAPQLLTN
ncbi:MAG: Oligopeptide transport system permease protein OppB (TC 3.A.1.5.1) [uncultured Sulfurovum sp.]|uniref:Oligopeptide transport system permease protein OppB (TC 3.A.1.5.1) n=1 Tax=uncultured Sulfurovum sp. TaxID=269237 RepID=A0A6S6T4I2_9BACT|nr:MAG: Oligopeptide transport system permease protein OppB (TC 3.A.1.5.1) [uncultured Sulfurovum sp.]